MPIPQIEPDEYRLETVDRNGQSLITLMLKRLCRFPKYTVAATV